MKLLILGLLVMTTAATALELHITDNTVAVLEDKKPILTYRYRDVPKKPYVRTWHTPGGENILRDAPADHLHHHGLMFAIAVEDVNFWEESKDGGRQEHRSFTDFSIPPDHKSIRTAITETLDWRAPNSDAVLMMEERRIAHLDSPDPRARLLGWQSTLHCPEDRDAVTLSGSIYHGLGMRFPAYFDGNSVFHWAEDERDAFKDGGHFMARASWCAITVETDDKAITIAVFDTPENPRPALWFTMNNPFAYLSATLDLSRDPMNLEAGTPLTLQYGVAAWDGKCTASEIASMYDHWLRLQQ